MQKCGIKSVLEEEMSKRKKLFLIIFSILASIGLLIGIFVLYCNLKVKSDVKDRILTLDAVGSGYDCILVFGCGVREDGSPSLMLRDRLDTAVLLYEIGASEYILCSGDNGKIDYNEVAVMKEYLVEKGVPKDAIYLDHAGFSTYESACRAKEIFCLDKVVAVTQTYHMYRALYDLLDKNVDAVGVPCADVTYGGQTLRDLRELVARTKDYLFCLFDPAPTYLGEKIEIGVK